MRLTGDGPAPPKSVPGPHQGTPTPPHNVGASLPANRWYTVKHGDTLYGLAMKFYKSPDWPRIYNANQDIIANPDVLTPGTAIRIP